jgi:hypothetical protein
MYLDSSKNIKKKDYTHIKSVLDSALITFSLSGGYIKVEKYRKTGWFSAIRPTSAASSNRTPVRLMDSTSCITCLSTEGIINAFACQLLQTMPRLSTRPQA